MLPRYETKLFKDIFENSQQFLDSYTETGFPKVLEDDKMVLVFNLLIAKYGSDPINNMTVDLFKLKLFSTLYQYAPNWNKRIEIQNEVRNLPLEEVMAGSKTIYNHAYNPGTEPSTQDIDELSYVNDQNVSNYKRSKVEAYEYQWNFLQDDVTKYFLERFDFLFKLVVEPDIDDIYDNEGDCIL